MMIGTLIIIMKQRVRSPSQRVSFPDVFLLEDFRQKQVGDALDRQRLRSGVGLNPADRNRDA